MTQDRLVALKCRPCWICGSAMLTTVASRITISCAHSRMTRARPRRPEPRRGAPGGPDAPRGATWGKDTMPPRCEVNRLCGCISLARRYTQQRNGGLLRLLYGGTLRFSNLISGGGDMTTADSSIARLAEAPPMRADARRSRERLVAAATQAFAEKGAEAPLEDVAKRAGVGIGTLYRHFPTRLALQAAVFRSQVDTICGEGRALLEAESSPGVAFVGWIRNLAAYFAAK